MSYSIFVIDDEAVAREGISLALKKNYRVYAFESAETAIKAIEKYSPDLILLDIGLPGMNGVEALSKIKKDYPEIIVIMITAYEDVQTVVSAMKFGAHDYVVKPIQMDALLVILRNSFETIALRKEIHNLHEKFLNENLPCIIGESNVIQDVMELVKKVARSPDTAIMICGESGTGKELIARAIHYRSPNCSGPLVEVNCAAIPKELIESELFGYEKGAFSGAEKTGKAGLVEKAADGTLFLDEVGDLSAEAQGKLLRFLEEGEYYRVGGTGKRTVRTRVVSATNKDLPAMIADNQFRQDLYYRLAVVKIALPSLNQRRDDIVPIARHFLVELSKKFDKHFSRISPEAEKMLHDHHWSGNVRELKNMIEKGALLGDGPELSPADLGLESTPYRGSLQDPDKGPGLPVIGSEGLDLPAIMNSIEKDCFEQALHITGGNESKAARLLNLSRDIFRYRRQKLFN